MSDQQTTPSAEAEQASSSGGCFAIILAIVLLGVVFIGAATAFQVYEDEIWLVPGDPDNFDPVAQYEDIAAFAGDNAALLQLEAVFVRRDGTLDLNATYDPAPTVRYTFYRQTNDSDAPVGVGNSESDFFYRYVWIEISRPYQWVFATQGAAGDGIGFDLNLGMDRDRSVEEFGNPGAAIPAPQCAFSALWATAIDQADANPDAVATIRYGSEGYIFMITGTDVNLIFDSDCQLVN